jgi:Tol biopolymer transport system component
MRRLGEARGPGLVRLSGITDREVVYRRSEFSPPAWYIETFDLRTGTTRELYRTNLVTQEITDASLSPDGKQLAMAVRRPGGTDIYLLRVGETTPAKLMLSNYRASARGQAMWVATQDALILTGTIGQEQGIWRVPLNGNAPQRLKLNVPGLYESRLSSDGQTLAYTTQAPTTRELWMLRNAVK